MGSAGAALGSASEFAPAAGKSGDEEAGELGSGQSLAADAGMCLGGVVIWTFFFRLLLLLLLLPFLFGSEASHCGGSVDLVLEFGSGCVGGCVGVECGGWG